ncbi:hypothetical protein [Nonomuraea rhizosphaerae]|uniref:hypothetical protein n=1 Tax=Nonomuraea rhizosphaerae TaxID=2665663 RepID=UPI001C5CD462|nr:hypothetical protein [Nonomuraea rhizosphaerae]
MTVQQQAVTSPRLFRTAGGAVVTWTHVLDPQMPTAEVGSYSCAGCESVSHRAPWHRANTHAQLCHAIPAPSAPPA